jgi:hypothetical protein
MGIKPLGKHVLSDQLGRLRCQRPIEATLRELNFDIQITRHQDSSVLSSSPILDVSHDIAADMQQCNEIPRESFDIMATTWSL